MLRDIVQLAWFRRHAVLGPFLLRLFLGFVLVYGTQDNVFSRARMLEFRDFVAANGFPWPLFSAHLSAYAQLAAGLLIVAGALTRQAALVMAVSFAVALAMVHVGLPFGQNVAPLAMLFGSLFLLFHGAGPYSVDAWLEARASSQLEPAALAAGR